MISSKQITQLLKCKMNTEGKRFLKQIQQNTNINLLKEILKSEIMMRNNNSSSDDQDQNFEGHNFKKIQYNGSAFDSDNIDSINDDSMSDQQSKKLNKLVRKSTSNKEQEHQDKSKAIKKNRQSAKMSRLRKKQYQQKLQQTVNQLETDIGQRKVNIKNISDKIFNKFLRSNKDVPNNLQKKYKYLVQKINVSKKLLSLTTDIRKLKQPNLKDTKIQNSPSQQNQPLKQECSPTSANNNQPEMQNIDINLKQEAGKGKQKKRKGQDQVQESKNGLQDKISEKQTLLEMSIKAYMYEFGVKGCLRTDVIQRSKYQWLQTIKRSNVQPNQEICSSVQNMKNCLQRLDSKTKLLDYHVRQLQSRVKDKYAVQFMLDRYFFINNSTDTIYKKSQLKSSDE